MKFKVGQNVRCIKLVNLQTNFTEDVINLVGGTLKLGNIYKIFSDVAFGELCVSNTPENKLGWMVNHHSFNGCFELVKYFEIKCEEDYYKWLASDRE